MSQMLSSFCIDISSLVQIEALDHIGFAETRNAGVYR